MTVNSLTSVSLDPLLLLVCVDRRAHMYGRIVEARRFAINMLSAQQEAVSRQFAGQRSHAIQVAFEEVSSVPVLSESLGAVICTVERILDGGDHIIVGGRVDALRSGAGERLPLIYFGGQYRQIAA